MEPVAEPIGWLAAVQASSIGFGLRNSVWLYPAVETLHIVGFAVLVGSIVTFDLGVLRSSRTANLAAWSRAVLPVARAGFALAVPMGLLLFTVEATAYAANPAFRLKLVLLALAIANVAVFHVLARGVLLPTPALRVSAALSLVVWLGVLGCGGMIAYLCPTRAPGPRRRPPARAGAPAARARAATRSQRVRPGSAGRGSSPA